MADTDNQASPSAAGNNSVQLGIGTLIIIAIIVTMCSGKDDVQKIRKDTAELKQQVGELNRKLDTLIERDAQASAASVEAPATAADASPQAAKP